MSRDDETIWNVGCIALCILFVFGLWFEWFRELVQRGLWGFFAIAFGIMGLLWIVESRRGTASVPKAKGWKDWIIVILFSLFILSGALGFGYSALTGDDSGVRLLVDHDEPLIRP